MNTNLIARGARANDEFEHSLDPNQNSRGLGDDRRGGKHTCCSPTISKVGGAGICRCHPATVPPVVSLTSRKLPGIVSVTRWQRGNPVRSKAQPTVFGSERARQIWRETWLGTDFAGQMTDGEIAYVNALWDEQPGSYSFADTLCLIIREAGDAATGGQQQ